MLKEKVRLGLMAIMLAILISGCGDPEIEICNPKGGECMQEVWKTQVTANSSLTLDFESDKDFFSNPGDIINFNIAISNSGSVTIHDAINIETNLENLQCDYYPSSQPFNGIIFNQKCSRYCTVQKDSPGGCYDASTKECTAKKFDWVEYINSEKGGLRPGDVLSCTGDYTVNALDVENGFVTISASANTTHTLQFDCEHHYGIIGKVDSSWYSDSHKERIESGEETVTLQLESPSISLAKIASPELYSGGETIFYLYEITNTGNVPLVGPFSVTDDKIDDVQCSTGFVLDPGEMFACYAEKVIDVGLRWTVTNTAQAFTTYKGLQVESNVASASVNYREPEKEPEPESCPPGVCD